MLRLSIGFIFVLFGVPRFFPDPGPAQGIAQDTSDKLFLGLFPDRVNLTLVAIDEVAAGLCVLSGRFVRAAVVLLLFEMVGILSPLILLPGALFGGPHHLPNLLGQYILKDVVLLSAVLVLLGAQRGGRLTPGPAAAALGGTGLMPSMAPAAPAPVPAPAPAPVPAPGPVATSSSASARRGPSPAAQQVRPAGRGLLGSPRAVRRARRLGPPRPSRG